MKFLRKPYKSFETFDKKTISVGDKISFEVSDGSTVKGYLINVSQKVVEIVRNSESLNSEKWLLVDVIEGTMEKI